MLQAQTVPQLYLRHKSEIAVMALASRRYQQGFFERPLQTSKAQAGQGTYWDGLLAANHAFGCSPQLRVCCSSGFDARSCILFGKATWRSRKR